MISTLLLVASLSPLTLGTLGTQQPDAAYASASVALERWDVQRANEIAQDLLRQAPDAPEAHLLLARVRFLEGRYGDALAALAAVEKAMPEGPLVDSAREFAAFVAPLAELAARFSVVESEHFAIHFVDGPDRVLVRRALQVLERSYEVMGGEFGVLPTEKIRVEIFPDASSFQKASTLTRAEIETSGTIALCKFNRLMMLSPRTVLRGFSWCDTLCHEYVHYVLWKRNGATIPIWLHEGVAKYQEARWTGGSGSELTPLMRRVLKAALDSGEFVTFDEMHPSFAKLDDPRKVALASAEVLSIVRTVLDRGGPPLLRRMLDALNDGADWRQMFEVALEMPFEKFWASWIADLGVALVDVEPEAAVANPVELRDDQVEDQIDGQVVDGAVDGASADEDEAAARSLQAGRNARLGDLLYQRGLFQAAAIEYHKSIADDQDVAVPLLNRVAQAYRKAGDVDAARGLFERALAQDPEYAPTLTELGLLHRDRADAGAAVDMLERAATINPYDPRIHQALAEVYGALGRHDERRLVLAELESLSRH